MLDVTLRDGDGVQVMARLRQARSDLPVVLTSGFDGREVLGRVDHPDTVAFLAKPFSAAALGEAVTEALARVAPAKKQRGAPPASG